MKALILAAGKGTRLKPMTNSIAKHLIPVANKPLIYYILEQIQESGIEDVGIVISTDTGEEIKTVVGDGRRWGIRITYIVQVRPLGIADAVKTGREFLGDSPFLLFLGDNLLKDSVKGMVTEFNAHPADALIALKKVDDPKAFGVAELNDLNQIIGVEEKPQSPKSNLAIVGAYIFGPIIHRVIEQIQPSKRGEYEITDAIQKLLDNHNTVNSYILPNWWLDTGKKEDLLKANATLLEENITLQVKGEVDEKSQMKGEVEIGAGSQIENSLIRGPVSIGSRCHIINSYIGPHVSIGEGVIIENSAIMHSIVLDKVTIKNIFKLTNSVIGRNACISGREDGKSGIQLFVGDSASVEL